MLPFFPSKFNGNRKICYFVNKNLEGKLYCNTIVALESRNFKVKVNFARASLSYGIVTSIAK